MRYSAQRQAIIETVCRSNDHPTAETVFKRVQCVLPRISLSTVYRNLSELTEVGVLISMETEDGLVHYDGSIAPHRHFICNVCKRITDLGLPFSIPEEIAKMGFEVENIKVFYYGKCPQCKNIKHKKENPL